MCAVPQWQTLCWQRWYPSDWTVASSDGEVKIWLEPEISVAKVVNLSTSEVNTILDIVQKRKEDINADWNKHFSCN